MTVGANDLTVNEEEALFAGANQLLSEKNNLEVETFREQLILTYQKQLLQTIITILVDAKEKTNALEILLQKNWDLVKCSYLCYTVHSEDSLTELLCDIAQYVGQKQNKSALNILMPGISTDSAHDTYPDLAGEDTQNIKQILKSYILGESGAYLVPIRLLNEWSSSEKQYNPYFDYALHNAEDAFLKKGEFDRLSTHSADARAISEAQAQYEMLLNDNDFLGHLQALIRSLRLNEVGGVGSETHAGELVYNAIIRFNDYYSLLDGEIKNKIPAAVKKELNLFMSLSSNSIQNTNATANMETCIATRGTELSRTVKAHENALSEIGIDGNKKRNLLERIKKQIEVNKQVLIQKIEDQTYVGNDDLGLTLALLEKLNLKPRVSSLADLNDFMTLSAEEIKGITETDDVLQAGIIQQFTTLESFVVFSVDAPLEQFKALLPIINHQLREKLFNRASDLSACLMPLVGVRFELIVNAFSEKVIKSGRGFKSVLQDLILEKRAVVFNVMKDTLPKMIANYHDFLSAIKHLSPEQFTIICNDMKDELPHIINNRADFLNVLQYLDPEQGSIVCNNMKDALPRIIKDGYEFRNTLKYLTIEQQAVVINAMRDALPKIIKNANEFNMVMQYFFTEQRAIVFNAMKGVLPQMINNSEDFQRVIQPLAFEQRSIICNIIKDAFPKIIKNIENFQRVIQFLALEQVGIVCSAMKDVLPKMIESVEILQRVFQPLSPEKRVVVFNAMKAALPKIINNGYEFSCVLQYLTPEQCAVAYEQLKDKLPNIRMTIIMAHLSDERLSLFLKASPTIFNSTHCLGGLLSQLNIKFSEKLLETLKEDLPDIINNKESYNHVLSFCGDLQSSKKEAISKKIQQLMSDKASKDPWESLNLMPTLMLNLYREKADDKKMHDCASNESSKYNANPTP